MMTTNEIEQLQIQIQDILDKYIKEQLPTMNSLIVLSLEIRALGNFLLIYLVLIVISDSLNVPLIILNILMRQTIS